MRFGWLTLAHSPSPEDDRVAIHEQLAQACHAEAMGFDGVWLTEHNFTGESVYCDPIPFASALAVRTSRVRIGFAVIQMGLRHPVRLATELAVIDNLSNGRLDVGVGRGSIFNEYEYVGFGLRSDDSRDRMAEAIELMRRSWTDEPLEFKGRFFASSFPALRPRPVQRPHPPIWQSVVSPPSFSSAGRQGVPIMTVRLGTEALRERLALYEAGLAESGLPKAEQQRLRREAGIWRHVYVGESRAEAEDSLAAALLHTRQHMNHARDTFNPGDFRIDPAFLNPWTDSSVPDEVGVKFALANGAIYGTAADVAAEIAALKEAGVGHVLAQMSFGYLPHERIMASMTRFGESVLPRFR
jgi:alkanesulfonate monooxygenase SsuD/methylene tetrahydromethanopterin reductase-like flavin-dependent oxidoreductase (luciferase family)